MLQKMDEEIEINDKLKTNCLKHTRILFIIFINYLWKCSNYMLGIVHPPTFTNGQNV